MTREQMAVFRTLVLDEVPSDGYCGTTSPFTDAPDAVLELQIREGAGRTWNNCGDRTGFIWAGRSVTRAQMAVFFIKHFWRINPIAFKKKGRVILAPPFFIPTLPIGVKSLWAESFAHCYVGGKFETPKSCEIQTICAIMKENRVVTGMARSQHI